MWSKSATCAWLVHQHLVPVPVSLVVPVSGLNFMAAVKPCLCSSVALAAFPHLRTVIMRNMSSMIHSHVLSVKESGLGRLENDKVAANHVLKLGIHQTVA